MWSYVKIYTHLVKVLKEISKGVLDYKELDLYP